MMQHDTCINSSTEFLNRFLSKQRISGTALVVGSKQYKGKSDRRALYKRAVGLDLEAGEGVDIVHDLETPHEGSFGHIDCCSVLEHVKRPWLLCANIEALMAPRATILVCVPFVWRVHAYPSDYWRMTPEALPILFPNIEWLRLGFTDGKEWIKKPLALREDGVYLQKTEVIGFGTLRNPSHSLNIDEGESFS